MALRINAKFSHYTREMRREPSDYGRPLWSALQLGNFKLRRQAVVDPYICDFPCSSIRLTVEVDDDLHAPSQDRKRDFNLAHQNFGALRFSNADVRDNLEGVLTTILERAKALPQGQKITHPTHSLPRQGFLQA